MGEFKVSAARKSGGRPAVRRAAAVLAIWASGMAAMVASAPSLAQQASATGEVRRVDAQGGTVALRHDEIKALGLPAMTLVYQAAPALLKGIKPGDKVRFTATRQDGRYVVIAMEKTMLP
jgi:Cu/Ag efflux protein CusF